MCEELAPLVNTRQMWLCCDQCHNVEDLSPVHACNCCPSTIWLRCCAWVPLQWKQGQVHFGCAWVPLLWTQGQVHYCCYYYYHHCPADRICTNCNNNWVHYRPITCNKTLKTRYGSSAKAPSTPYRPVKCQQHQAPAPFFVFLDANVCYTFLDLALQCTFTCYNMCASNVCFQKTEHPFSMFLQLCVSLLFPPPITASLSRCFQKTESRCI